MTEFSAVSLRIETVGDREALTALNNLDRKGREIVEGVAGATGRALGDVAVAYEAGSKRMRQALADVANGHADNIRAMQAEAREAERVLAAEERAAERLAMRNEHAIAGAARGLEMVGRTGNLTGRSLDAVIGQVSQMAFAFGPGGQLVAAIGIGTAAMVEMFMRTSREAKKAADEAVHEFDRIAHLDVRGQGEAAQNLYSGDPFAADYYKRTSLAGLRAERARLTKVQAEGTTASAESGVAMTQDAEEATEALKKLNAEIEHRNVLLLSITGKGGTLERAGAKQAAEDLPGFTTDAIKAQEEAAKRAAKAAERAAKAAEKEAERYQKEMLSDARDAAAQLVKDAQFRDDFIAGLLGLPSKEEQKRAFHDALFALNENIAAAIANDPLLKFNKAVKELAKKMRDELNKTLGEGLAAGFEAAFTGKGITGAFEALTTTVLAGLGGFMEQLGAQMVIVGLSLTALSDALLSLNGPAAIAAGVALIAAGAGLKAIAGSFGHSSSGGGGGGSYSSSAGIASVIDRGVINPGSYSQSDPRGIPNKAVINVNATIFGTNDAAAQRGFDEMMRKANQRGSLAGAG